MSSTKNLLVALTSWHVLLSDHVQEACLGVVLDLYHEWVAVALLQQQLSFQTPSPTLGHHSVVPVRTMSSTNNYSLSI